MARDNALDEIRRLYFNATRTTIQSDIARAIDLLKGMRTEEDREKATVYMEGLAQMRSEWAPGGRGGDGARRRGGKNRNEKNGKTGRSPKGGR